MVTPLKNVLYTEAMYRDYSIGGQTYTGRYKDWLSTGREFNNFSSMFDNLFYSVTSTRPLSKNRITLTTNFLLFENEVDLNYYLQTGDASKALDYSGATEGEEGEKYLYCITKENTAPIRMGRELPVSTISSLHMIKV